VTRVPYFSQFETPRLVEAIVTGALDPREDPAWPSSGARDAEDYARWSRHACGMACLKMILAASRGTVVPTLELLRASVPHGCYVESGETIKGLIYAPFVRFVAEEFCLSASVVTGIEAAAIVRVLPRPGYFIASVHPWIRWPEREPPARGGHLVLVLEADAETIVFNNPSGHVAATQAEVRLPVADFQRYFAGRGIAIGG